MSNETLVIDTGASSLGIYSIRHRAYRFYQGDGELRRGVTRVLRAKLIVTFNGLARDMEDIARFMGLKPGEEPPLEGRHIDMRAAIWGERIWGKSLFDNFTDNVGCVPRLDRGCDPYEADNQRDVFMTWQLFMSLKRKALTRIDREYLSRIGFNV